MGITKKTPVLEGINLFLCLICFIIVVVGTGKYGPGVTHDSVAYLFSAASMANGEGLQYFGYTSPFIQWPPFYSWILTIPVLLGINPVGFSQYFNAVIMALALWVGSRTVGRLAVREWMPTLFIFMGILSFQLLRMSFYVWSEPLFILLSMAVFHILLTTDFNQKKMKPLVMMGLLSAVACLTRYIGVVLVAVACLYLFIRIKGFKNKLFRVFTYGVISAVPTLIYIIRNYMVSGTLVGMRSPSGISLSTNLYRAVKTIAGWLFPMVRDDKPLPTLLLALIAAITVVIVCLALYQVIKDGKRRPALISLLGFCVFYSFYMAFSASKVAFDPVSDRYMIPVFMPLLTWLVLVIDGQVSRFTIKEPKGIHKIVNIGSWAVLTLFLAYFTVSNGLALIKSTQQAMNEGAGGFNSNYWRQHAFLQKDELFNESDMIYSNDPSAVHYLTGKPSHFPPKTFGIPLYGYEAFLKESSTYSGQTIIWFGKEESSTVYTPQKLSDDFTLTELYKSEGLAIYSLERKEL